MKIGRLKKRSYRSCLLMSRQLLLVTLIVLILLLSTSLCYAQEITVAAATDLRPALDEIASQFEPASGVHLHVIYGSSGDLLHSCLAEARTLASLHFLWFWLLQHAPNFDTRKFLPAIIRPSCKHAWRSARHAKRTLP